MEEDGCLVGFLPNSREKGNVAYPIADTLTGLFVVRCPECGTVQPVQSLSSLKHHWHKRLSAGRSSGLPMVAALRGLPILGKRRQE